MNTQQRQRGEGLVGMLVAAVVFAVGIAAVIHLQGGMFQNSRSANARALAMNIGEETLETLRSFQAPASTEAGKGFVTIVNNAGVGITSGSVTRDNIVFTRNWGVTDYYSEADGDLTTTVTGGIVQKRVIVSVTWKDADGTAAGSDQTATLTTVINKVNATSAAGALESSIGGTNGKPDIPYTPSTAVNVVPIGVGTDAKRETLVQADLNSIDVNTFVANTYSGSNILLREEEFKTVACECELDGTGDAYTTAYPKWNTSLSTYIDEEGISVSKKVGVVANNQQNDDCITCCNDHHDKTGLEQKYDPYRVGDFNGAGDHNHYDFTGTLAVSDGDEYLEACRFKRVNGYWRVYQDWHMVALTVLPTSDLIDSATRVIYETYVKAIIDAHLVQPAVNGEVLSSSPTKPAELIHTSNTSPSSYVALGAVGDKQQLTARAVYLDYIYNTAGNPLLGSVQSLKSASADYLLHVPFYEVEVAAVSSWTSTNTSNVLVGPVNSSDLLAGEVKGKYPNTQADVTAEIKRSNSGVVALTQPVDTGASLNPDNNVLDDTVTVTVGSGTPTTTTSTSTSTSTSTTTSTITSATCTTVITGRVASNGDTASVNVDSVLIGSCPTNGRNYTCPSLTTALGAAIEVSSMGVTEGIDTCGPHTYNF